jgi:hypothetical protein
MNPSFYDQAKMLDICKSDPNPSIERRIFVISLIREEKYSKYFFDNLDNPAWVIPLFEKGIFFQPPDPIEVQPGHFQLPGWPSGEYLAKFADKYEDIVIEVIKSVRTENWRVQEILVDAMMKISPFRSAELITAIDTWLDGRFSRTLPIKLSQLTNYFVERDMIGTAIQILEYVITPIIPAFNNKALMDISPIRFRADNYWINEYCIEHASKLSDRDPIKVVSAFTRQLERAIYLLSKSQEDDAEIKIGYYLRMDIPIHSFRRKDADALDILIDEIINGLNKVCSQSPDDGRTILEGYLATDHIIFKRIAMFILRQYGQNYTNLIEQALLNREYLDNHIYTSEYQGLLRDQFGTVSEEIRERVVSLILSGPSNIDLRAKNRAQWAGREVTYDDYSAIREEWWLYNLEIVHDYLHGESLSLLEDLTAKRGKVDVTEQPHITMTTWGGAPSPLSSEELSLKSLAGLKQFFLNYVTDDRFLNPRESLAQTFQGVVSNDPARFAEFAPDLIDIGIRFVYVYHYLSGMSEGVKKKEFKFTDGILNLCEYVVDQKEDPYKASSGEFEPGLKAAQMEVANLLVETLRSKDLDLTREQLDRIRSLILFLSHHQHPTLEDENSTSFDPFTYSLNCIRGKAMHGIFLYSLYVIHQLEKRNDQKIIEGYLEPEIRQVLEEKLDLTIEPSLAVHSVYGSFVPQLHYLSREWLEQHLIGIFPVDENYKLYWAAAWDAYIFVSNVYTEVFNLLIPQYKRGIRSLSESRDRSKLGGSPDERLAQHVMFAYLKNLTGYDDDNKLLELFFQNAPDAIRAKGIFWISQILENDKPSSEDDLWKKCWSLWQSRMEHAEDQEVLQNTQEISEYMRWLEHVPVQLDTIYPILCESIKYLHDNYDIKLLIEYAGKSCDVFPLEAINLLLMTISSSKEPWWPSDEEVEEKILKSAMSSGDEEARRLAIEVINTRGEQGNYRWKSLLK